MLTIRRSDAGAIALVTVAVAVVLIIFAAFAVDLGNAFARKRMVQSQADFAALAGAALLDGTPSSEAVARTEAAEYLFLNEVLGDDFTAAEMLDGSLVNGEIEVFDDYRKVRVTAPPATVGLGFAGVIGQDELDVQAVAVAGIFTPGALAPFFIAEGCLVEGGSRLEIKTDPGNVEPADFVPNEFSPQGAIPSLDGAPTPFELLPDEADQEITVPGDSLETITHVGLVWGESAEETLIVTDDPDTSENEIVVASGAKKNDPDTVTFVVPKEVVTFESAPFAQSRVVYVQVAAGEDGPWSDFNVEASFTTAVNGVTIPDACGEKSTGDFGLIDSPRSNTKNLTAAQQNVAEGLDHAVVPYPGGSAKLQALGIPSGQTEDAKWNDLCVKYEYLATPDALVLDEPNPFGVPNCLNIYTGNKAPVLDAGLIEGGSSPDFDGRLYAPKTEACDRDKKVVLNQPWTINDDLLSCYIKGNSSVNDVLTAGTTDILETSIVDSPRFLIVPVIYAEYPPANGNYPIVDYRGAMISAELPNSTRSNPKPEPDNGLIISNKKVGAMTVTYFNLETLPEVVSSTGNVLDYIGTGPKVIRLLQ